MSPLIATHGKCRRWLGAFLAVVFALNLTACGGQDEWEQFWRRFQDRGEQPSPATPVMSSRGKGLQGTIGQLVTIDGLRLLQVSGFGLVIGLAGDGGTDGPDVVKNYLVKEIRRMQEVGAPGIPAGDILGSRDSAMVAVTGSIPAGAQKGDRFDVVIEALGTQTKSLVGGRLVLCDLKLRAETPMGVIEGKTLAMASGPLFVTPFDRAGRPVSEIDLRQARVMSGGIVKEPRRIRLILTDPRYSVAQQIRTRINGRYAGVDPIADAKSAGAIDLTIPPEERDRLRVFLERVMHTTLNGSTPFLEQRATELSEEITDDDAEYETIAMAWEAIGKLSLPHVKPHYGSETPSISYYSGRTGMRLGDLEGMRAVAKHARDPQSPLRKAAIDDLGYATRMVGAGRALMKVLDDPDVDTRIQAYQALRRHQTPAITSTVLDQDNLILDVVESSGSFVVFVQRVGEPRVALFGPQMRCLPPAIFPDLVYRNDKRRYLTQISAQEGDADLTVFYTNKKNGQRSPKLKAPLNVVELVKFLGDRFDMNDAGEPTGLAVPYSEIVDILGAFCKCKSIPATFVTDEMAARKDEDSRERPESEY